MVGVSVTKQVVSGTLAEEASVTSPLVLATALVVALGTKPEVALATNLVSVTQVEVTSVISPVALVEQVVALAINLPAASETRQGGSVTKPAASAIPVELVASAIRPAALATLARDLEKNPVVSVTQVEVASVTSPV